MTTARNPAYIFDMDGVLVGTVDIHFQSWQVVLGKREIKVPLTIADQLKGQNRKNSLDLILTAVGEDMSPKEKTLILKEKNQWFLDRVKTDAAQIILPGVIAYLDQLKALGIPMAVASASRNAAIILEETNLEVYFECMIGAQDVRRTKPDPEAFINAARDLQTPENQCIVFEDSHVGVAAGLKGGMKVVAVNMELEETGAHYNISSFEDLSHNTLQKHLF